MTLPADSFVLHLYAPEVRASDQLDTWELLGRLQDDKDIEIVHCPGPDEYDNTRAIIQYWGKAGTMVLVEQDILCTRWRLRELLLCPEPVCAWDFPLANGVPWSELPDGTGIGFWKATEEARRAALPKPILPMVPWHDVAWYLKEHVGPAHVHRPLIGHNHRDP